MIGVLEASDRRTLALLIPDAYWRPLIPSLRLYKTTVDRLAKATARSSSHHSFIPSLVLAKVQ